MNPRLVVSTQEMPLLQPRAMTTGELMGFMVSVDSPQLESAPQATLEIAQECYSHVVEVGTTVLVL